MSDLLQKVFLVGQLYYDTILHVKRFPEEDTKLRADRVEQRVGGNACNTAQVLAQMPDQLNVYYMSAVGSYQSSKHMVQILTDKGIHTKDTVIYREEEITPFSTIIHSEESGSRTIVSGNNLTDLEASEFVKVFTDAFKNAIPPNTLAHNYKPRNNWWVHFEGRNIYNLLQKLEWLNYWKRTVCHLTVSVELEKPDRENINSAIKMGDVVFFSKLFAQYHGFKDAQSFLLNSPLMKRLKPHAKAFCTWGSEGASVLLNETKQILQVSPPPIERVVDTVGAGDTFNAGIIYFLSQNPDDIAGALQFACNLATKKVSQQGFGDLF